MRTKTLLLSAAALLAAGFVSTQAQPVYSQNIVGYASVPTPASGQYYMLTVPFAIGTSNGANEVFGNTLPSGSTILTWSVNHYITTIYDSSNPAGLPAPVPLWYQGDDFTPATIPVLQAGQGFFLVPNGPITNTFAGTVAVNVGTSNVMSLPNSGQYYMVGSAVPYAGAVTNGNSSTGGPNLNNLPSGSTVLTWSVNHYITTIYDTSNPAGLSAPVPVWYAGDDFTPAPVPSITVGQGLFIVPNGAYVWTTGL